MITGRKAANAMGGRTARACDGCLRKRARWFCAADDAFLCQACDASVHSANQLASRHERIRLETASSKINCSMNSTDDCPPAWHQGFTRKARTPRYKNNKSILVEQQPKDEERILNPLPLVPEIGCEEEGNMISDENEDQLLHRVPVFDPFSAELCDIVSSEGRDVAGVNKDGSILVDVYGHEGTCDLHNLPGFLPSDMDIAQFAADVENLMETVLDEDSSDVKGLFCEEEDDEKLCFGGKVVKVEDEQEMEATTACHFDQALDRTRGSLDWNFDYESPADGEEQEEKVVPVIKRAMINSGYKKDMKRNVSLRLNYEAVITAWDSQCSPWTTGTRPEFNPDDSWPDCMGSFPEEGYPNGGLGHAGKGDGCREAKVLRYKEKRRTRLFSKRIRYEVRKLNAEKRPRMKGRFVKRASFVGTAFPYLSK